MHDTNILWLVYCWAYSHSSLPLPLPSFATKHVARMLFMYVNLASHLCALTMLNQHAIVICWLLCLCWFFMAANPNPLLYLTSHTHKCMKMCVYLYLHLRMCPVWNCFCLDSARKVPRLHQFQVSLPQLKIHIKVERRQRVHTRAPVKAKLLQLQRR